MNRLQELKIKGLELRITGFKRQIESLRVQAAMWNGFAEDRESTAAVYYGGGSYLHLKSLERAEEHRTKAKGFLEQARAVHREAKQVQQELVEARRQLAGVTQN